MNELAILGTGAVTPAGVGWSGIRSAAPPVPVGIPSLRRPDVSFPVFRVPGEPLERWRREPRLRRASPITHLLVEAATQALADRPPGRLALVGAFFSGASNYSRLFFEPVIRRGPSFASPALFPDTVYNSSLSHAAHVLGVDGASYAVVGDDCAWTTALQVAAVWLDLGEADHVLVLGAEELDAVTIEAYAAAGWLRSGFVPAEGAAALLLGRPEDENAIRIRRIHDGIPYRSRASAKRAATEIFAAMHGGPVLATAGGTWMKPLEEKSGRTVDLVHGDPRSMGHAFTATAGWNTLRAVDWLSRQAEIPRLWQPVWGLHNQISALELQRPAGLPLAVSSRSG